VVTDTKARIVSYIRTNGQAQVKDLVGHLGIGPVAIHRHLKRLVEIGQLAKAGTPPKVFYRLAAAIAEEHPTKDRRTTDLLDKYYAYVDPTGQLLTGLTGFITWAKNVGKQDQINSLLIRYIKDRQEANQFITPRSWIDAAANVAKSFPADMHLDGVYYLDFYSLPTFGKTRLGSLMLYAKQSENKPLIWQTAEESRPVLSALLAHLQVEAVGFVPHSILRKVQFLKEFSKKLNLNLPTLSIIKAYPGRIRVAQKTLGKLEERITNARETIFVENPGRRYSRVLLIDDAVGSGATLNETAKKLKVMGIAKQVYGFAVVGSLKGFDIIREV